MIFTALTSTLVAAGFSTFMAGLTVPAISATHKEFVRPRRNRKLCK